MCPLISETQRAKDLNEEGLLTEYHHMIDLTAGNRRSGRNDWVHGTRGLLRRLSGRKSSFSIEECVVLARLDGWAMVRLGGDSEPFFLPEKHVELLTGKVAMFSSKDPEAGFLTFTPEDYVRFLGSIKAGDFDDLVPEAVVHS